MKRSHLTRLQDSDVFSVPASLGLKALRQNSITSAGMEMFGLHPLSSHLCPEHHRGNTGVHGLGHKGFANKWGVTEEELLERGQSKDLEKEMANDDIYYGRPLDS